MKKLPFQLRFDFIANFLNTRSGREKLMFIAMGGFFLVAVDFFLWLNPVIHSLTRSMPLISSMSQELETLKEDKKNAESIKKKWVEAEKDLSEIEKGIEISNQLPALLESLSRLAMESGVRITSLKPIELEATKASKL